MHSENNIYLEWYLIYSKDEINKLAFIVAIDTSYIKLHYDKYNKMIAHYAMSNGILSIYNGKIVGSDNKGRLLIGAENNTKIKVKVIGKEKYMTAKELTAFGGDFSSTDSYTPIIADSGVMKLPIIPNLIEEEIKCSTWLQPIKETNEILDQYIKQLIKNNSKRYYFNNIKDISENIYNICKETFDKNNIIIEQFN